MVDLDLDDEVRHRQGDLGDQDRHERGGPDTLPGQPRQRSEDRRVQEVPGGVEPQLDPGDLGTRGQTRTPLVVVEGVEGADDALDREEPQRRRHHAAVPTWRHPS